MPRLSTSTQTGQPQAVRVELTTVLTPGGSATAYVLQNCPAHEDREGTDAATDTDEKLRPQIEGETITIDDRWGSTEQGEVAWGGNYLLPGERAWVRFSADTKTYDVVGSNGLLRKAVADEDIDDAERGTVSVWYRGIDSGENVEVLNNWGSGSQAISSGDELWIKYEPSEAEWIPFAMGSASGCDEVRFQVVSADPLTRTALGEILSRPVGCSTVPDSVLGGTVIEICDPAGCFFNEPGEELTDRQGWARYMQPAVVDTCQPDPNYLVPQWEVFSLCCAAPDCDVI